jgi:hypothetical protein
MTRLERRIAELAEAMFTPNGPGASIYIGTYSYKQGEWFAGCQRGKGDLTEGYGSSAEMALDALVADLRAAADRAEYEARRAAEQASRLKSLGAS